MSLSVLAQYEQWALGDVEMTGKGNNFKLECPRAGKRPSAITRLL